MKTISYFNSVFVLVEASFMLLWNGELFGNYEDLSLFTLSLNNGQLQLQTVILKLFDEWKHSRSLTGETTTSSLAEVL